MAATAQDLGNELKFLDKWHERALGSDLLRSQLVDRIARVVISLVDDILSAAQVNLWTAFAGGPPLVADLEYQSKARPSMQPVPC